MIPALRKTATCLLIAATVLAPTLAPAADGFQYFRLYGRGNQGGGGPATPPAQGTLSYQISGPSVARVGQAYAATSAVAAAVGPTSFVVKSGSLPPGVALNPATGAIAGVPTLEGAYSAVIAVQDTAGGQGFAGLSVAVAAAMQVEGSPSSAGTVGQGYAAQFSASGGSAPYAFSTTSSLPPGLTLSGAGLLSGVPSLAGDYVVVIRAQDQVGTTADSGAFTIRVASPLAVSWAPADGKVGIAYAASLPQTSGGRQPYHYVINGAVPGGLIFDNSTGGLSGTPTNEGTFEVGVTAVDADGRFAGSGTKTLAIAPGTIVNNPGPLALSGNPPTAAQLGIGYVAHFTASGGAQTGYVFDVAAGTLPPGLDLDAATGVISGAPSALGTYSGIRVRVTDAASATALSGPFSIAVQPAPALIVAGNPSSSAQVGVPYTASFTAFDGTGTGYAFASVGAALPPGLTLANVGGAGAQITGSPTQVGTYPGLKIRVTDSGGHTADTSTFSIVVAPPAGPAIAIGGSVPAVATVGTAYSAQLSASGGTGAGYVFSIASGALPAGLSLASSGLISGAPTTAQTAAFTVQVVDSANDVAQTSYSVVVSDPLAFGGTPTATNQGASYLFGLSSVTSGGRAPYGYVLTGGALPSGMTLNGATGAVSSSGVTGSTSSATVQATDADGRTASASLTFAVAPATASASVQATAVAGVQTVRAGHSFGGLLSTNIGDPAWGFAQSPVSPAIAFEVTTDGSGFTATAPSVASPTNVDVTATASNAATSVSAAPFSIQLLPAFTVSGGPSLQPHVFAVGNPVSLPGFSVTGAVGAAAAALYAEWSIDGGPDGAPAAAPVDLAAVCPGLSLDGPTGVISGVPTAACSVDNLRMTVTDGYDGAWGSVGGNTRSFAIQVVGDTASAALTSPAFVRSGAPIAGTLSTNLASPVWSFSSAPTGLSLTASGSTFSGTAPAVGAPTNYTVTATATQGTFTGSAQFALAVAPAFSIAGGVTGTYDGQIGSAYALAGPTVSHAIGAVSYMLMKDGAAVSDLGTFCPGLSFNPTGGGITGTSSGACYETGFAYRGIDAYDGSIATTSPTFALSFQTGLALTGAPSTANQGAAYSFDLAALASGGRAPYAFAVTSGSLPAGMTLSGSTVSASNVSGGTLSPTITVTDADGRTVARSLTFAVTPATAGASLTTPSVVHQGQPIGGTLSTSLAAPTWSLSATPASPALALTAAANASSTTFSGTAPAVTGQTAYTVTAGATRGAVTANAAAFQVTVKPALAISNAPSGTVSGQTGSAFASSTPSATNGIGTISYSLVKAGSAYSALATDCPGLSFAAATGVISGTPSAPCSVGSLTLRVTDAADGTTADGATFSISAVSSLVVTAGAPANGTVGVAYSKVAATVSGGTGSYTSVQVNSFGTTLLSFGLTATASGSNVVVAGTPNASGTWTGTFRVTDSGGTSATSGTVSLTINTVPTMAASAGTAVQGNAYSSDMRLLVSGGRSPYVVTFVSGSFPTGLSLSNSVVSGTTGASATQTTATLLATDADGRTVQQTVTFPTTPPGSNIYAVGGNANGQLGDGTTTMRTTKTAVAGGGAFVQIEAAYDHSCGVLQDGTVQCWGAGGAGQIGDGFSVQRLTPTTVSGLSNVVSVAAGSGSSCAVTAGGALYCWGAVTGTNTPTIFAGYSTGVAKVGLQSNVGGGGNGCIVTTAGAALCWGGNTYGAVGDGTTTTRTAPTQVTGLTSGVTYLRTNFQTTCAVVNGAAKCWGYNGSATIGDGTTTTRLTPAQVTGLTSGVTAVDPGENGTCALVSGGVKCWSSNGIMSGGAGASLTPAAVPSVTTNVTRLSVGADHVCVVQSGALVCWGYNFSGQLGTGNTTTRNTPAVVSGFASGMTEVRAGYDTTFAR